VKWKYQISPKSIVENESGCYETWVEKIFCDNYYMFFAKQISVKVNGVHYHIDPKLNVFRYAVFDNDGFYKSTVLNLETTKYEIELNKLRGQYSGEITGYKRAFNDFKMEVIYSARNQIRIV